MFAPIRSAAVRNTRDTPNGPYRSRRCDTFRTPRSLPVRAGGARPRGRRRMRQRGRILAGLRASSALCPFSAGGMDGAGLHRPPVRDPDRRSRSGNRRDRVPVPHRPTGTPPPSRAARRLPLRRAALRLRPHGTPRAARRACPARPRTSPDDPTERCPLIGRRRQSTLSLRAAALPSRAPTRFLLEPPVWSSMRSLTIWSVPSSAPRAFQAGVPGGGHFRRSQHVSAFPRSRFARIRCRAHGPPRRLVHTALPNGSRTAYPLRQRRSVRRRCPNRPQRLPTCQPSDRQQCPT